ncbi:hypothetical protein BH23GEM7_BH23GEM7_27170 [soil metagenome]
MNLATLIIRIAADDSSLQKSLSTTDQALSKIGGGFADAGKKLTLGLTAPLVAMGGLAVKSFMGWETAMAGVSKTIDGTPAEINAIGMALRSMSETIPVSASELANIAAAAGQLGIDKENIVGFTRVMADLGVATNLSSEEAATSLARFANITNMSETDFDRLGSTVVALGNNLATTESEIVTMGMRLAGAGSQIGLSQAEILSFAGALSSVGIEAESGGTAFSKLFIKLGSAVATGGPQLQQLAAMAGMTGQEFATAFQTNAAGAVLAFITGLGNVDAAGGNTFLVLEQLGLTEVRLRDALLRASGASDLMAQSLQIGTQAWADNNALTNEAALFYSTLSNQLQITWNRLANIGAQIGEVLAPVMRGMNEALFGFLGTIQGVSANTLHWGIALAGVAAAIGPLLFGIGKLIQGFVWLKTVGLASLALLGPAGLLVVGLGALSAWFLKTKLDALSAAGGVDALKESMKALSVYALAEKQASASARTQHLRGSVTMLERDEAQAVADIQSAPDAQSKAEAMMRRGRIAVELAKKRAELAEANREYGAVIREVTDRRIAMEGAERAMGSGVATVVPNLDALGGAAGSAASAVESLSQRVDKALDGMKGPGLAQDGAPLIIGGITVDPQSLERRREETRKRNELRGALDLAPKSAPAAALRDWSDSAPAGGGGGLLGGLGGLFGNLASGLGGMLGGIGSAVGGFFTGILGAFAPLQLFADILAAAMAVLGPVIDAVKEPLRVVGMLLGMMLAPILRAFFPILKLLAIGLTFIVQAVGYVGGVLMHIVGGIASALGSVITGIGKLIGKIPGLGGLGKSIQRIGQGVSEFGSEMREGGDEMLTMAKEMPERRKELEAMKFGDTAEDVLGLGESAKKLNSELVNTPEGFRIFNVSRARFEAALPPDLRGGASSTTLGGAASVDPGAAGAGGTYVEERNVSITGPINIEAHQYENVQELWRELKREIMRERQVLTGEAHGSVFV